nr:MAG TPA: capsid [Picobirnaviridae sp.]
MKNQSRQTEVVNQPRNNKVGKSSRKDYAKKSGKNIYNQTMNGIELVGGLADLANPFNRNKGQAIVNTGKAAVNGLINGGKAIVNGVKALLNHPEWYEAYLPEGLVNLNYGRRKGMVEPSLSSYGLTPANTATDSRSVSVPLCGRLNVDLVIPKTTSEGWEQGIRYLFNELQSTQTGTPRFTIRDLEAYVISVRNFHAIYADLRRAFATMSTISAYDATTPKSLLMAMGWAEENIAGFAADVRNFGVLFGRKISKLAPMNVNLINRTRWMFSNIFADSNDMKHASWVMNLSTYPMPTWGEDGHVTGYTQYAYATAKSMWLTFHTAMSQQLNAFVNQPIMSLIASVMLKAYGGDAFYPVEEWDIDMPTPIIYDEAALTQIQNAVVIATSSSPNINYTVTSDAATVCNVVYTATKISDVNIANFTDTCFVNMYKDNVTAGETLSATRFSAMFEANNTAGANEATINFNVFGTELMRDAGVIYYDGKSKQLSSTAIGLFHDLISYGGTGIPKIQSELAGSIDWSPMTVPKFMIVQGTSPNSTIYAYNLYPIWDFNNYAVLDSQNELSTLHDYAILSLLKPAVRQNQGTFRRA